MSAVYRFETEPNGCFISAQSMPCSLIRFWNAIVEDSVPVAVRNADCLCHERLCGAADRGEDPECREENPHHAGLMHSGSHRMGSRADSTQGAAASLMRSRR
jgi:hypothetical protein